MVNYFTCQEHSWVTWHIHTWWPRLKAVAARMFSAACIQGCCEAERVWSGMGLRLLSNLEYFRMLWFTCVCGSPHSSEQQSGTPEIHVEEGIKLWNLNCWEESYHLSHFCTLRNFLFGLLWAGSSYSLRLPDPRYFVFSSPFLVGTGKQRTQSEQEILEVGHVW